MSRWKFDSMDICQSAFANFFVRVAAGQYDLKEPDDLIKLLLTMTRNEVTEKMRRQHRLRRDSRRTVGAVEELAPAGREPSPSRVVSARELLEEVRQRLNGGGAPFAAAFKATVRRSTETLCEPLAADDYVVQSMPDASPVKWHLAHTTWFFETFMLAPHMPGYQVFHRNLG